MTTPSEDSVVRAIMGMLRGMGGKAIKVHGDPYMEKGTPDVFAVIKGVPVLVEAKTPEGVPTKIQLQRIVEWRCAGARVGIAVSAEEAHFIAIGKSTLCCNQCGQHMVPKADDQIGIGWAYVHCPRCNTGEPVREEHVYSLED